MSQYLPAVCLSSDTSLHPFVRHAATLGTMFHLDDALAYDEAPKWPLT
jgi:hypothetical protein